MTERTDSPSPAEKYPVPSHHDHLLAGFRKRLLGIAIDARHWAEMRDRPAAQVWLLMVARVCEAMAGEADG